MATNTLKSRITLCVKTSTEWASSTTVLLKGEFGIESDTLKCKIGDGVKTFAELAYSNVTPTGLTEALKTYAELASPAFTGTPTAPTASADTNNTQIATTEFVKTVIGSAMSNITQIEYQRFDTFENLPSIGVKGIIYLIPNTHGTNDSYDEYMWFESKYEKIGSTDVDLSGYQIKITGAATTILVENLTANRALISNADGKVAVSDVTSTELGYLKGVTADIQAQLNDKAPTDHTHSIGITGGATATTVKAGTIAVNLNVTSVSTSVLNVPSGDALVLDGNF